MKLLCLVLNLLVFFLLQNSVLATTSNFISVINPVRGGDFWEIKNQKKDEVLIGQKNILSQNNIPSTWLIRPDAFNDTEIKSQLKSLPKNSELGLFLEITPTWTKEARVKYRESKSWHQAGSVFLTGYTQDERIKLINSAFEAFKKEFGEYPKSVGAWWVDSFSLDYMQEKFGITSGLVVADQYSTDDYQIWGHFWSTPYYPMKRNALYPAQSIENKIPVVLMQWAARDPVNAYGNGVLESTYSVQPNDYIDYHDLDINYFRSLLEIYTNQNFNQFNHIVVGLENSYSWKKYGEEYERQIKLLSQMRTQGKITLLTMADFSNYYQNTFVNNSPVHILIANDPLNSDKKTIWFMNPYYRIGIFIDKSAVSIRDVRQYVEGSEEICFRDPCRKLNFATTATRVLDDVTFGHKLIVDEGKIDDLKIKRSGENFVVTYKNQAGLPREIRLMPRDIAIDGKISTIDGFILDATNKSQVIKENRDPKIQTNFFSFLSFELFKSFLIFLVFLVFLIYIPGAYLARRIWDKENFGEIIFLPMVLGIAGSTLIFFISGLIGGGKFAYLIIGVYLLIFLIFYFKDKIFKTLSFSLKKDSLTLLTIFIIISGTIFQVIPVLRSGINYDFGIGFWGPNGHDGLWHIALPNQLLKSLPPENPVLAGEILRDYHYFYDLILAYTHYLSGIEISDLLFRFYPLFFSLLLGIGSYLLAFKLFSSRLGALFSLYFVYFAGSFGWIVEYIRSGRFGGESAFWANQSISYNLNPPFAISLLILIAIFLLLEKHNLNTLKVLLLILLSGVLIEFKAYAAILLILTYLFFSILNLSRRKLNFLKITIGTLVLSFLLLIPNYLYKGGSLVQSSTFFLFEPFWFIHSMVDSPDRVGWARLTQARLTGYETGNMFKFLAAEALGLLLFIVGNLGLRIFGLIKLILSTDLKNEFRLFLVVFSSLSLLIPILFIQQGNPWNTIQFIYYFLYICAIFSGSFLVFIIRIFPKAISIILVTIILVLTPLGSISTALGYFNLAPHAYIPKEEVEALKFLEQREDGIILTYPFDESTKKKLPEPFKLFVYETTSYIPAYSKKVSYVDDEIQNIILQTDYQKRLIEAKNFFKNANSSSNVENLQNFIKLRKIKYIYLNKYYLEGIDEKKFDLEKIFENNEIVIYQVK